MMEMVATTGAVSRAKSQSNCHHQQTNAHWTRKWGDKSGLTNSVGGLCSVIGCGELPAPPGTHVRRDDAGGLMVVCDASRETFRLVCIGRRWTGKLHNCSRPGEQLSR